MNRSCSYEAVTAALKYFGALGAILFGLYTFCTYSALPSVPILESLTSNKGCSKSKIVVLILLELAGRLNSNRNVFLI